MTTTIKVTDSAGHVTTQTIDLVLQQQSELIEFSDFAAQNSGKYVPTGSLIGKGRDITTYQMKPNTSTKTAPTTGTNPYRLMRVSGQTSATASKVDVGEFTLNGTNQGMYYGGLTLGYGTGSTLHGLRILGIPGYASSPPGETFSLALFHSDNAALNDIILNGKDDSGQGVAATLLGYNYTSGTITVNRLSANNAVYGFGLAMFQCTGTQLFTDCDFRNNRKAVNIEKSLANLVRFTRCDFRGTSGAAYIAQISSGDAALSTKVEFVDCIFDNDQCVVNCFASPGPNGTNGQKDSDITRIDNGVVQTSTAKFKITHV